MAIESVAEGTANGQQAAAQPRSFISQHNMAKESNMLPSAGLTMTVR
jgi:hypothetical protein